jgi:hypothetical protein
MLLPLLLAPHCSEAWGFWAHQRINYLACFTLPPEIFGFYKQEIRFVFEHAVDPDKRRYSDPDEAPRHFIDLDRYGGIDSIPHRWSDAACLYTEDTLKLHGIVPWAIQRTYYSLIRAFTERDAGRVLYYSAVLGHYVADAHVPLHCTSNYNGQLTGQKGIHGFWESRLPELFGEEYDFFPERCRYLSSPLDEAWSILRESSAAVDSVLTFEKSLNEETRPDRKFAFEERGTAVVRVYSQPYAADYHSMLDGQVERRMRAAIHRVGSYWYSAWLDAGQPILSADSSLTSIPFPQDSVPEKEVVKARVCE